jgi:hypothetical protein
VSAAFSLPKRYFEPRMSTKRLARLLSLLSFFCGPIVQDLWSSPKLMQKWVASYALPQNDSSLSIVHGQLEVEGALVQSLSTKKNGVGLIMIKCHYFISLNQGIR